MGDHLTFEALERRLERKAESSPLAYLVRGLRGADGEIRLSCDPWSFAGVRPFEAGAASGRDERQRTVTNSSSLLSRLLSQSRHNGPASLA